MGKKGKADFKKGGPIRGIEYPVNKRLEALKKKANAQYKDISSMVKHIEETHTKFRTKSVEYANTLHKIEVEAEMPNFGDR